MVDAPQVLPCADGPYRVVVGEQQDPAANPLPAQSEQGPVILQVTALGPSKRSESLGQKNRGAFEVGEITGRCFDCRQRLKLVQVILQAFFEKFQAVHRPPMRHYFQPRIKVWLGSPDQSLRN